MENTTTEALSLEEEFDKAIQEYNDFFNSTEIKSVEDNVNRMNGAHGAFHVAFDQKINSLGLLRGGSGPSPNKDGSIVKSNMFIIRNGTAGPRASFVHITKSDGNRIEAEWKVPPSPPVKYFSGSVADEDFFVRKAREAGFECALETLKEYNRLVRQKES